MQHRSLPERLALGAVSGFVGTFALQGLRSASGEWLPQTMAPIRQDPGEFMVERAEEALPSGLQERVPEVAETVAGRSLAVGYGVTAGALYASFRPEAENVLLEGAALGLGVWAVGYLGWLPALELMPSVREQDPAETAAPVVRHLLFGLATVGIYHWLSDRL